MTEVTANIPALPSTSRPVPRGTNAATQWLVPVGLIVLSIIPVLAGALRLTELMGGPESPRTTRDSLLRLSPSWSTSSA
jgi:hypothetical protein